MCLVGSLFLPFMAFCSVCVISFAVYRDGREKRQLEIDMKKLDHDMRLAELAQLNLPMRDFPDG